MASSPVPDPVVTGRTWAESAGISGSVGYAPGRVNLIGEHLDYNGGPSLPIAIPYWTYVATEASLTPGLRIESAGHEPYIDDEPADASRGPLGAWHDYVVGTIRALSEEVSLPPGLTLRISSTLPPGAGLSSSASLTIATALSVDRLCQDTSLSREAIGRASRAAENDFVGAPTGDLDQCAILGARPGFAVLCRPGEAPGRHVPWEPGSEGLRLLVVATGVRHQLSDGGYAARVRECRSAASHLGVENLADPALTLDRVMRLDSDIERRRARHVVSECARVAMVAEALDRGDPASVGRLLLDSHASLRDDFEVSCDELDLVVEAACEAGAIGARMTGGGFGGSAIVLSPAERVDPVVSAVRTAFATSGLRAPSFLDGHAVGRAGSFSA